MSEELQPVFEDWDSRVMEVERLLESSRGDLDRAEGYLKIHEARIRTLESVLLILKREK